MRLFLAELRKIWNWKILLVLLVLSAGTFFALARDMIDSTDSLITNGFYGPYQQQMYQKYGDTLEPDELADFDIPGQIAQMEAAIAAQIASDPVFAKYGISTYQEFQDWENDLFDGGVEYLVPGDPGSAVKIGPDGQNIPVAEEATDDAAMQQALYGPGTYTAASGVTVVTSDSQNAPAILLGQLQALQDRYSDATPDVGLLGPSHQIASLSQDRRPVVRDRVAVLKEHSHNLIAYDLTEGFSQYAAITGALAVVSVMILVAPVMVQDRLRRIHQLQYSSHAGRGIVWRQLLAASVSALLLSLVQIAVFWTVFLVGTKTTIYWGAHIANSGFSFWMYNLTFGHYAFLLAGLVVLAAIAVATASYAMSLTSASLVAMFVKVVPIVAFLVAVVIFSTMMATSSDNVIFNLVFRGRIPLPEIGVCLVVALAGTALAVGFARRERHVNC